jgi:hypothetical protein
MDYRHDRFKSTDENITRELGRAVNNRADFVRQLEAGKLPRSSYPDRLAMALRCPDCGELCWQIIWCAERYLVHATHDRWTVHVCPDPVEDWHNDPAKYDPT